MTNTPVKLLVVAGIGGARADLLSGWLGTLPGFINSRWIIDPLTGVSYGHMGMMRGIDSGQDPEELLTKLDLSLSSSAEFTWAVACHGFNLNYNDYKHHINSGAVKFVYIDISNANLHTISWEFFVKTYLSHRRVLDSVKSISEQWVIGRNLSDDEKAQKLRNLLKSYCLPNSKNNFNIPCTYIDYTQAFGVGGSSYIARALNLSIDDVYHQYWDSIIPFTHSPNELTVWGVNWRRSDWFPN